MYLEAFIEEFGEPTKRAKISTSTLGILEPLVPKSLLAFWKQFEFSEFHNGLFRIINPLDWEYILQPLLEETGLSQEDRFLPLFVGAFGNIDLFGIKSGLYPRMQLPLQRILVIDEDREFSLEQGLEAPLKENIGAPMASDYDLLDNEGNSIFQQVLKNLGELNTNQIYGLQSPASYENLQSLDEFQLFDAGEYIKQLLKDNGAPIVRRI